MNAIIKQISIMRILFITLVTLGIVACKSTQNTTTSSNVTPTVSKNGIMEPRTEELSAIQLKKENVSMENLKNGYAIYIGVCTNCHGAKSIYSRSISKWPSIIDDMSKKSKLNVQQKEDLTNYIFAIKATQPISTK